MTERFGLEWDEKIGVPVIEGFEALPPAAALEVYQVMVRAGAGGLMSMETVDRLCETGHLVTLQAPATDTDPTGLRWHARLLLAVAAGLLAVKPPPAPGPTDPDRVKY